MTPKRWFWSLTTGSLLWALFGYHWETDHEKPIFMHQAQNGVAVAAGHTLVPAQFVFTLAEATAVNAIQRVTRHGDDTVPREQLEEQIQNLEAQKAHLQGLLAEARELAGALRNLPPGLTPDDVLEATLLAQSPGPGASLVQLDKGATDGVKVGMAAVAPLEQVTVLGRVVAVGPKICEVRLLTDPQMVVQADIVRTDGTAVTSDPCTVIGMGGNQMKCETINVQQAPPGGVLPPLATQRPAPVRGDLVRLTDPRWPPNLQFMLIGIVENVGPRQDQALRYDVRILPPRPLTALKTVMIVIKE